MRADYIRTSQRGSQYEPHEDTLICRMVAGQRALQDIAAALERSEKSVQQRIHVLRKAGDIAGYSPRRKVLEVEQSVSLTPPLELRLDDDLVRTVRRLGGFPRAEVVGGRTFWLTHDNRQWQYGVAA